MQKKNSIVLRALCLSGLLYISPVYSMGWLNKICREIGRVGDQVSAETTRACHSAGNALSTAGNQFTAETERTYHSVDKELEHIDRQRLFLIGQVVNQMNQAGNDTVGKIPGAQEVAKVTGGVSVGIGPMAPHIQDMWKLGRMVYLLRL